MSCLIVFLNSLVSVDQSLMIFMSKQMPCIQTNRLLLRWSQLLPFFKKCAIGKSVLVQAKHKKTLLDGKLLENVKN